MPREGYLVNAGEDTIHSNEITADTKMDKFKNWWYYNKKPLFIGILVVGALVSMVLSVVFKVKPDYTIAIMSEAYLDDSGISIVENHLADYGEDLNGDGKVIVTLVNYAVAVNSGDSGYDVSAQQAATVKFAADMSTGESMLWLHDLVGYHCMSDQEDLFTSVKTDKPLENSLMIPWSEVAAFQNIDFSSYQHEVLKPEDMKNMFGTLRLSLRRKEGSVIERKKDLVTYYEASEKFLNNLLTGTKVPRPEPSPAAK
ncbi:MAG: hypothetical protein RSC76_04395 [Oscillospiraceae bacterium]